MNHRQTFMLVLALIIIAMPAAALDSVELQSATGRVREESFGVASPTPAWCYWDYDPVDGPLFQATNDDGYGNADCREVWSVHCDSDSLVFRGSWVPVEVFGFASSHYEVELACSVTITTETRLRASRQVSGALDTDEHTLTVTFPDGTAAPVLSAGSGQDEVSVVLLPGVYQIALTVEAHEYRGVDFGRNAYVGRVLLAWEAAGTVAVEGFSWSALKALYW